ncbi:Imidazole glycerol phosphate synthase cyclase subunit [Olavius algarvensis associated proteobacterium Delta 3]|nr:Imidazole glycerol phosphate synthase cyclase subunit [Olavius algarvensis associated proteobacterium Delta 3]CAB5114128.1 Imidazole glycerol phosphate synthase cyclase subunit [Olavius algarvensis associated proteobacterium Delta 3]
MNVRIIPRMDIKGPNLVKGIHMEGLRVLGKPEDFARYYYEQGADELLYMDVVASLYERNSLKEIITRTAKEVFIPLTVGGGMRSIDDIREALRAGADKVAMNTAAINNPEMIREASRTFGSSTIVAAIEVIRQPNGDYLAYTDNGREHTGVEALQWACRVEELGAGEILLTSVDKEGTGEGYDLDLIQAISRKVTIPVVAHGGPGEPAHVAGAIRDGGADAVAVASILHYEYIRAHKRLDGYDSEGNIEFLKSGRAFTKVAPVGIPEVKAYLQSNGITCRIPQECIS